MLTVAALSLLLTGWSLFANLVLGERLYTTRNAVLTVVLVGGAIAAGLSWDELGLAAATFTTGLRWGLLLAGTTVVVVATAAVAGRRVRGLRRLFEDRRADLPTRELVRHSTVRIPLGTAVFEEVAFRGVLLGAASQVGGRWSAIAISSVVFGLWHIAPTVVALRLNHVPVRAATGVRLVVAGVLITGVAGVGFAWLRLATGSLLAPILLHTATNVSSLLAAAVQRRRRPQPGEPVGATVGAATTRAPR